MNTENNFFDTDLASYQAIDLLVNLINIPSISREEKGVADYLENWMQEAQLNPIRVGNNLILKPKSLDPTKPTILLNSHMDTVKPVTSWHKPPFEATQEEDRIYGLGSNDAGASLVSLLLTYCYLFLVSKKEQPYNLIFVASAEEEVSGKGGLESVLNHLPTVDFAIVGEPTGMNAAIAEKGLMVIDGKVFGKSGHAARNEGINAIYKALPIIEGLQKYQFEKVSSLLGPVKLSVTQINAGSQHNVIPDLLSFVVDVRTNECYSNKEVFDMLSKTFDCELTARSFRLNSSSISENHPFAQRVKMLGKELFGSPTLSDQALMPFPSVKIGPGDSARSHTADEYILNDEIREAIALYIRLLDGLLL